MAKRSMDGFDVIKHEYLASAQVVFSLRLGFGKHDSQSPRREPEPRNAFQLAIKYEN